MYGHCREACTDKKNFPYIRNSDWSGCKVIYEEGLPNIWDNAQIFSHILGGRSSYMTLQPLPSGFPYIWGKFCFLFYQCAMTIIASLAGKPNSWSGKHEFEYPAPQRKSHLCIPFMGILGKFETNIPRKGIARPQSQFPPSNESVSDLYMYYHRRSPFFCCRKYVNRSWEYINRSQTHEGGNWDWGRAILFLGIFVSNFQYWFFAVCVDRLGTLTEGGRPLGSGLSTTNSI